MRSLLASAVLAALCSGCAALLPSGEVNTSSFASFDEARQALLALVPMQTTRESVYQGPFNPANHPNMTLLTHADVVRRYFLPNTLLTREDLDPGVIRCVQARSACSGLDLSISNIRKRRTGNFLLDLANFHRHTVTTGWRLQAVILFVDDLVVYRAWGGQPAVHEEETTHNPLGPLQDINLGSQIK